jgi:hypothetical protein
MNAAPNHITRAPVIDVLDADMTAGDLIYTLGQLRFDVEDEYARLWIDKSVRDFLVRILSERRK